MALSARLARSFSSGSSARLQTSMEKIGDAHAERRAFHEKFPHLLSVPFPPTVIEDDGDDEGKMTCLGLISSRTDFILLHEYHVSEQLEGACRGRIVLMLEDDVDVSLFAVLRGAPEDEIRDGFPQSRCDEAFPCRFKAGDVQNFVHIPRQELPKKVF